MGTNTNQPANFPPTTLVTVDFSSSGDSTIVSGVTGGRIVVYQLALVVGGTTTITFKNGSVEFWGGLPFTSGGSIVLDPVAGGWFTTDSGSAFVINSSAGVQVSGGVYYALIDKSGF